MTAPISQTFHWKKLTPDGQHFFFGYYDRNPWDNDIKHHLVLHIPQIERLPERGEKADIGILDVNGNYQKLTETRTWCHQQGCMELFLRHRPDCFVYNDYDEKSGRIIARIFQLGKGIIGHYKRPIYAMSPDGKWAVSLDFSRIPRRGYSYADAVLSDDLQPKDPDHEGIWLMDLHTGTVKLVCSYSRMFALHPYAWSLQGQHTWLNHAIFNCDSSRLLWLFRQCPDECKREKIHWWTFMYTSSLDGSDAECIIDQLQWDHYISHQIWGRTPREILVDASWDGVHHGAVVFDESRHPWKAQMLSPSHGQMAHMVFSPDGKWILADSYPDKDSNQHLVLINAETGTWEEIGCFHHEPTPTVETRNDIHPRWSQDGRYITVDSTHDGFRGLYLLDLKA